QQGLVLQIDGTPVALATVSQTSATYAAPSSVACDATFAITNPSGQSASTTINPGFCLATVHVTVKPHAREQPVKEKR
ncbi:MAG: hypothetical protein CME24_14850, partial [Gemmatimonadetes bacterium]|nr:hypothetical protein [Gemmatimonadota bacterium]